MYSRGVSGEVKDRCYQFSMTCLLHIPQLSQVDQSVS